MSARWDPARYLHFADERGRPFVELMARVPVSHPREVVDLGCGPGNLTRMLVERWPDAHVTGVDSSAEMIDAARAGESAVEFEVADLRDWVASPAVHDRRVDVLVSNATLQWLPDHLDLLPRLVATLAPGGWLAIQVPGNVDEPSHTLRRALEEKPPYAEHTRDLPRPVSHDPDVYLRVLAGLGCVVDAWETTYLHVLHGDDPVFSWIAGTSARPALQALPEPLAGSFATELRAKLRAAYPASAAGVVLPFRRVFAVAQVAAA